MEEEYIICSALHVPSFAKPIIEAMIPIVFEDMMRHHEKKLEWFKN
jgi:hypothetical protein